MSDLEPTPMPKYRLGDRVRCITPPRPGNRGSLGAAVWYTSESTYGRTAIVTSICIERTIRGGSISRCIDHTDIRYRFEMEDGHQPITWGAHELLLLRLDEWPQQHQAILLDAYGFALAGLGDVQMPREVIEAAAREGWGEVTA